MPFIKICLGVVLILFKSQLMNYTLKQRERFFHLRFSDEQRVQAEVISILGGLYMVITGIMELF